MTARAAVLAVAVLLAAASPVMDGGQVAAAVPGWSFGAVPMPGPLSNDRMSGPAGLTIGGRSYVFWYEDQSGPGGSAGGLMFASHDGNRWVPNSNDRLDGLGANGIDDAGAFPVALSYRGQPHLFYFETDRTAALRHAWLAAGAWHFESLPSPATTRPAGPVAAVVFGGVVHLWYAQHGEGASATTLGHSWMSGNTWRQETLDGAGGTSGRISAQIGGAVSAEIDHGLPHVFYFNASGGNLRQGWWTGAHWQFATLDGTPGPYGRLDSDLGGSVSAVNDGGVAHVYYYDAGRGNLRQAWWAGTHWQYATLDGATADAGSAVSAAPRHVFYYDATTGNLRQAWYDVAGRRWQYATLDGAGGPRGRVTHDVGSRVTVAIDTAGTQVYYRDTTTETFRYAWWR
jgi:hypothetical protein